MDSVCVTRTLSEGHGWGGGGRGSITILQTSSA